VTGADVKRIREALGETLGRRVSQRDLGLALGLAPANAADTVRRWEHEGPSGPAAVALELLEIAASVEPGYQLAIDAGHRVNGEGGSPEQIFREMMLEYARYYFTSPESSER
jgi:transcriptional regulator with XRE-family HTH domain